MIIRRIYLVTEESKGSTSIHQLRFTMRILIESGFLYLATAIAHFVVWWTPNSYAISVISGIVSLFLRFMRCALCFEELTSLSLLLQNLSVTGIAFNLILIRAAQRRVEEEAKIVGAGPISGIHFRANETKTPVGQFGVNTTQATAFQHRHEASNSMNGHASTTASIASVV